MEPWVWQGVLTSIVAGVVLALAAAALTWAKGRWPTYGPLVLYWLQSLAVLVILWFGLTGSPPFAIRKPTVTPDNIEANIKKWAEDLGMGIVKVSIPDTYFAYSIMTRDGLQIQVGRSMKEKTNYLQFVSGFQLPSDAQVLVGTLTHDQVSDFTDEIAVELNKSRLGFAFSTFSPLPPAPIGMGSQTLAVLQKAYPIADMTEYEFSSRIDDINFTASFLRAESKVVLKRMTASKGTVRSTRSITQN